jgi:hypothetical protein
MEPRTFGRAEDLTVYANTLTAAPEPSPRMAPPASPGGPTVGGAPTLETTFSGGRREGRLRVTMSPLRDVRDSGYEAVFGAAALPAREGGTTSFTGFPTLLADVEPQARGYENWLGWIQLVNERSPDGRPVSSDHDPIWFLRGKDVPYGAVGYAPRFFDAPSRPARKAVLWEADLFLCTVPSVSAADGQPETPVEPLAGVRWGFRIDADGGEPASLAPRWTGDWAWASWVPILRKSFPTWSFADRTPSVSLRPASVPPRPA